MRRRRESSLNIRLAIVGYKKYFGNNHKKRYSLFYRPRFYNFFKFIIILSCFAASQAIFYSAISLTRLIILKQPHVSNYFTFIFISLLRMICHLPQMKNRNSISTASTILKYAVVHAYTNVIWPILASFIYIGLFCDSNSFVHFSRLFIVANSLSPITFHSFKILAFALPLEQNSLRYIVKSIMSYMFLEISALSHFISGYLF